MSISLPFHHDIKANTHPASSLRESSSSTVLGAPNELPVNLQHWGFTCNCILCQDTQSTGRSVLSNRNRISIEVQKFFKSPKMNLQKIEDAVMSLAGTYC